MSRAETWADRTARRARETDEALEPLFNDLAMRRRYAVHLRVDGPLEFEDTLGAFVRFFGCSRVTAEFRGPGDYLFKAEMTTIITAVAEKEGICESGE